MTEGAGVTWLVELCVGREHRRRGAGSALVAAVIAAAKAAGHAEVKLGVHADNARARRLYARHGFVAEGESAMALRL
jgi:ribosomal protein S18 acetylase RimI-like enzyme